MPSSYIEPAGALSVGSTQAAGNSLNRLRNYRAGTAIDTSTTLSSLDSFFRTYTQNTSLDGSNPFSFSQFRGGLSFRININQFTQCSGRGNYHDQSDGILRLAVSGGSGGNFQFLGMTSNQTVGNGVQVSWTNLAGSYTGNTRGDYSLTIVDVPTGVSIAMTLVRCWETGYGTSFIRYQATDYTTTQGFWNRN